MIDDSTTATTNEICKLAAITKQHLGRLEQQGVVRRAGRDEWPLVATMNALLVAARQRSAEYSEAKARFEKLRAEREKLKLLKESREVCYTKEFDDFVRVAGGLYLEHFGSLPIEIAGRDLQLRNQVEQKVRAAQQRLSDALGKLAEKFERGEAA
jgi:hypothetical protein